MGVAETCFLPVRPATEHRRRPDPDHADRRVSRSAPWRPDDAVRRMSERSLTSNRAQAPPAPNLLEPAGRRTSMRAAVAYEVGQPLVVEDLEPLPVGPRDVL